MRISDLFNSLNLKKRLFFCTFIDISLGQVVNMDETPCYFDLPNGSTVETTGVKTVSVATSGYEKMRFTVVLGCTADGRKLRPMLIFKNLKNIPKLKAGGAHKNCYCLFSQSVILQ